MSRCLPCRVPFASCESRLLGSFLALLESRRATRLQCIWEFWVSSENGPCAYAQVVPPQQRPWLHIYTSSAKYAFFVGLVLSVDGMDNHLLLLIFKHTNMHKMSHNIDIQLLRELNEYVKALKIIIIVGEFLN